MATMIPVFMCLVCAAEPALTIDLSDGWRFRPDADGSGLSGGWAEAAFDDAAWSSILVGQRWEDQGHAGLDGYAWYRIRIAVPAAWQGRPVWLVLGGANDACSVFCNGKQINSYGGDVDTVSVGATPLIADMSEVVQAGAANVVAVRVFDWGGSGGLWTPVAELTCDRNRLPLTSVFATQLDREARALHVDVDVLGLGNEIPRLDLVGELFVTDEGAPVARESTVLESGVVGTSFALPLPDTGPGKSFRIRITPRTAAGAPFAHLVADRPVTWPAAPSWPGEYAALRVRNNFVTELCVADVAGGCTQSFLNPRHGWVYFGTTDVQGRPTPRFYLDGGMKPLVWRRDPRTGTLEAMQHLAEGRHAVRLEAGAPANIDIRAVPELAYCYYLANPHIAEQGPYDRAFLERHVLSHVNTLIAGGPPPEADFQQWLCEGRRWISNAGLPGLNSDTPPTADEVFTIWAGNPGVAAAGYSGLIVDEFLHSSARHYSAWSDAVERLYALPGFAGRTFYAWCGGLFNHKPGLDFGNRLAGLNGRICWECYLEEEPTRGAARRAVVRDLQGAYAAWAQAAPALPSHLTVCLGYLSAPPESLNTNPTVNYHVFKEMQVRLLATEPSFWGLSGLMDYSASYADEEALRWTHRLFRHYCIEGSCEWLSRDPYELPHLVNPDFAAGTDGWQVEAAAPGSVRVDTMAGFSWLQGRYPRTQAGDQFLVLKRTAGKPNQVRQPLRALEPGRLYSLKLIAADLAALDQRQKLALGIAIDGAEVVGKYSFQSVYPSNYAHEHGPYHANHPAYFNYVRMVFRPSAARGTLSISDWAEPDSAGGPAGQEIAMNFVEVQPFLAPE